MLEIKVFQNGVNRIYITDTFKEGMAKSEFGNFLEAMTKIDFGNKKLIGFEDLVTGTNVFISPVMCLIEVEETADK